MSQSEPAFSKKPLKWYDRLSNLFYEASIASHVGRIRAEAPMVFRKMINDIDTPLEPEMENQVARYLRSPYQDEITPSETLMPRMMQKYGISSEQFAELEKKERSQLNRRCNQCPSVSQCWKAMRNNAKIEECDTFCANQASFKAISH